jgi:hypothetical protein
VQSRGKRRGGEGSGSDGMAFEFFFFALQEEEINGPVAIASVNRKSFNVNLFSFQVLVLFSAQDFIERR